MIDVRSYAPSADLGYQKGIRMNTAQFTGRKLALAIAAGLVTASPLAIAAEEIIDEILVTAQKRSESLQDVAVAVTALSDELLRDARIIDTRGLVNLTPSLTFQDGGDPRTSSFNIRGIGTQSFSSGVEPSVSMVLDGVVMGSSGIALSQLLDIERVEILRGPQGTLFGKNASAGLVHIITRRPSESFEAEVTGRLVEGDEYRVTATVSGPLGERIGYRLAALTSDRPGHIENLNGGDDLNGEEAQSVRGKLLLEPTEDVEILWSMDYTDVDTDCCQFQPRSLRTIPVAFFGLQGDKIAPVTGDDENDEVNTDGDVFSSSEAKGSSIEVNWSIGDYTLTSITAYREWETDSNVDVDGTPVNYLNTNYGISDQDQLTQELRIASPAADTFSYVAGLYYFDQSIDRYFTRGLNLIPGALGFNAAFDTTVDTTNYAAFGQFTVNLSDDFRLIGGARYTNDELEFDFLRTGTLIQNGVPIGPLGPISQDTSSDDDSYKAGAQWDINDEVMAYATWSQGYKGVAYNVVFEMAANTQPIDPETSDAWEVGLKSRLLDGRLVINAAAFLTTFENFQTQAQAASSAQFETINAGEVETKGLEVDFMAVVAEGLDISGGFAYIDASIEDLKNGPCSPRQRLEGINGCAKPPAPISVQDLSGGDLPFSPDWRANISANYRTRVSDGLDLVIRGTYRWQDDVLFAIDQDEMKVQDAYGILDLSVALRDTDDRYEINLFLDNALDESYADIIIQNNIYPGAYDHYLPKRAQRTAGIELRYSWF